MAIRIFCFGFLHPTGLLRVLCGRSEDFVCACAALRNRRVIDLEGHPLAKALEFGE